MRCQRCGDRTLLGDLCADCAPIGPVEPEVEEAKPSVAPVQAYRGRHVAEPSEPAPRTDPRPTRLVVLLGALVGLVLILILASVVIPVLLTR